MLIKPFSMHASCTTKENSKKTPGMPHILKPRRQEIPLAGPYLPKTPLARRRSVTQTRTLEPKASQQPGPYSSGFCPQIMYNGMWL